MNSCIVAHINDFLSLQNLTKDEFCKKYALNKNTLNRLYNNDQNVSLEFVAKISLILDIELSKMFV